MRRERDKLEKNPKTLQLLRNTNSVVRIAGTTKRLEVVEKPGKNRGKKMRTPEPMNTNISVLKEIPQ